MLSLHRLSFKRFSKILQTTTTNRKLISSHNSFRPALLECSETSSTNTSRKLVINRLFSTSSIHYSSDQIPDKPKHSRRLPPLMEFQEIVWPSLLKTIKNWVLINFIIKPYFDNNFTIQDFISGSKQALEVIL